MNNGFRLFPEQASTAAEQIDRVYFFVLGVAAFFTLLIFILIVVFAIKYRRGSRAIRSQPPGARYWLLEVTWTLIPLGLTLIMFGWGAELYVGLHEPPEGCLVINVVAKQWMWKLQHPNGRQEINALHIPVDRPIRLRMISEDVIHSFYAPNFRLKQDVLPATYTTMWFQPTRPGTYHLFCAEYCGTSHSKMGGWITVQTAADYAQWLQGGPRESPTEMGQQLYREFRCDTCHDGPAPLRGPPLDGVYGREVRLTDGRTVTADDEYLRESIVRPNAKIVAGYQGVMPSFEGQIGEEGILQIVAYLKSRSPAPVSKAPPPAPARGSTS